MPASFSGREAQLALWLFPCFWVVDIGRCQGESDKRRWEVTGLEHCCCCRQPADTQARPSLSLSYYPIFRNSEIVVSQFGRLMTYPQLQRWMPSASLHSTPLLGLFYFCCFGFARPLCVCCFAVVRLWTVSMALHGRASSLWDNLPCLFDHTCLCRLHLLKVFTRKASWVSGSPGAHLSVRKWKDYAFIFFDTC